MKRILKPFALLLSAVLAMTCLIACSSEPKATPQEMFQKIEQASSAVSSSDGSSDEASSGISKLSMTMSLEAMDQTMTGSYAAEFCGNVLHIAESTNGFGQSSSSETYTVANGDTETVYTKNGSSWTKKESTVEAGNDEPVDWQGFDLLFKDENYGEYNEDKGCYELKEGLTLEVFGFHIVGAKAVINENSCEIEATIEQEMSGVTVTGKMTVIVEVNVEGTLTPPTVNE